MMEGGGRHHESRYLYNIPVYRESNERTWSLWNCSCYGNKWKKYAKAHMAGWNDISYQKLNARAVVDAIQCMKKPADVLIHLDNAYAEHMIEKGGAAGNAYAALWSTFFDRVKLMEKVEVKRCPQHEYTEYLNQRIREGKYSIMKDR